MSIFSFEEESFPPQLASPVKNEKDDILDDDVLDARKDDRSNLSALISPRSVEAAHNKQRLSYYARIGLTDQVAPQRVSGRRPRAQTSA
jgi:hypothetical protein